MQRYLYRSNLDLKPFLDRSKTLNEFTNKELSNAIRLYFQRLSLDVYESMFRDLFYRLSTFIVFTDGIEFVFINCKTLEVILFLKYPLYNYDRRLTEDTKEDLANDTEYLSEYILDRFKHFELINCLELGFRFDSSEFSELDNLKGFMQFIDRNRLKEVTKWKS